MKSFIDRHLGPDLEQRSDMLKEIGEESLDQIIDKTIPASIRLNRPLDIAEAQTEYEFLQGLTQTAAKNKVFRSFIGMGYYGTITPTPILRNLFQNPGWYTQYTPYQAEIAQGRLESLLNFQTMVSDLTALPIANASLLDEGTAAAEAMNMFYGLRNKRVTDAANTILVDTNVFPQTVEVLRTRAASIGIVVRQEPWESFEMDESVFAVLLQYPNAKGAVERYEDLVEKVHSAEGYVIVATDLLALTVLKPPGEWGADAAVGNSQRFGVPMGFGGPHAAFFATHEKFKRQIPGRIIGVSVDIDGNQALRMALQTREQHIRREKATSNICTAQALLANMSAMYAVYHGPEGLRSIAKEVASKATALKAALEKGGFRVMYQDLFDTLALEVEPQLLDSIRSQALDRKINLWYEKGVIQISLDQTTSDADIRDLCEVFGVEYQASVKDSIPSWAERTSSYLMHPVFQSYQTETKLMRYLKHLENKDLSLTHSMIPLGSCTMKLNAATQLIPVSWESFANIHPFVPADQVTGYLEIINDLADYLCEITGFTACSFQPNSGAQGEFAGLMAIRAYHESQVDTHRNVALIPSSAHGTNPASAVLAGMKVVIVSCDDMGNIDVEDLRIKIGQYKNEVAALMVTYPSTHGVFEESIIELCDLVHDAGGLVYMDGANMNAQVGLTNPARIGADVCHLNLHKTFAIPHGGGGPGMGPICVNEKLAPFLSTHVFAESHNSGTHRSVSSAPYGSASILLISYAYIKMLGAYGLTEATKIAILNANYLQSRLSNHYAILYMGKNGYSAHEFILDLRPFKTAGISAEDVAKRLIDYGFHAPTLSFPVAGTLMIEPTESEDKEELDRFCQAMIQIKIEIDEVARGDFPVDNNVLVNAPHTLEMLSSDDWNYPYSRSKAAYPIDYLRQRGKFWASVRRVDNAHGDRTLICTCPPVEMYAENSPS
ncbi:MAG: aminomethyl-transferring glycine dehydrogenase [Saprospiraceae bacterium]|nr:aminomethyl-transferring glycine dehydrogenase [Saprospiraceae bacterium]